MAKNIILVEHGSIDPKLESYVVRAAAYWTLQAVERFYEDPENMKAYKKWKKERKKKKEVSA